MKSERILIDHFTTMRPFETYDCDTLTIVATAKNAFLPELNPFNYEIGTFGINFDYDHNQLTPVGQINHQNLRDWKDFNYLFELQPENEYYRLMKANFGLTHLRHKTETVETLITEITDVLESGYPVIVACNPYHLFYTEHYRKNPGGQFQTYHYIVVYGISHRDNKVWLYDPTLTNFNGMIGYEDLYRAVEDDRGIDDFEGYLYFTLQHDGKSFDDMNTELIRWGLDYYLDIRTSHVKDHLLLFFSDFAHYFDQFSTEDFKNKLLEFGFYIFRGLVMRRQHWLDFFDYYSNIEDIEDIGDEMTAFKANIDRFMGLPNTLFSYTLKGKEKLNMGKLKGRLKSILDEEERIFRVLRQKIK